MRWSYGRPEERAADRVAQTPPCSPVQRQSETMPPAKHREPIVPAKVKVAVDYLFTTPNSDFRSAAEHAGLTMKKLRSAMMQPHVLRWLLAEKQARLEAASAGNIGALLEVRDKADNSMARVAAAKSLEQMLDAVSLQTGINRSPAQRGPGL